NTRNFTAQATLANPDGLLRPGAFAHTRIALGGEREAVGMPQSAVSFNPDGNTVFVIGEARRREGETGMQGNALTDNMLVATRGDLVEVTAGLGPGERVATSGVVMLRKEAEVKIDKGVEPTAEATAEAPNR